MLWSLCHGTEFTYTRTMNDMTNGHTMTGIGRPSESYVILELGADARERNEFIRREIIGILIHINAQTDRHTDRQTDTHTHTHTHQLSSAIRLCYAPVVLHRRVIWVLACVVFPHRSLQRAAVRAVC